MDKPSNPFMAFANMDFTKLDPLNLLKGYNPGGVDMQALLDSQRRNVEALAAANKQVLEGMQAAARRQAEIMSATFGEMQRAASELGATRDPRELAGKQAEYLKQSFERAIANMRELSDIIRSANSAAADTINQRISAGLDEIKGFGTRG